MNKVNVEEKFALIKDYWSPKVAGMVNEPPVSIAKRVKA